MAGETPSNIASEQAKNKKIYIFVSFLCLVSSVSPKEGQQPPNAALILSDFF